MRFMSRLFALAVAAALGGCSASSYLSLNPPDGRHPFPTVSKTSGLANHPVHGIDVSKYQGNIDWAQVRTAGVSFAWIKATEGADHVDHMFQTNWDNAKAAGVMRGAYHFAYWCSSVVDQINNFKRIVPVDPDALPPVLDVEWNHDSRSCGGKVSKDYAIRYMRTFLVAMEHHYGKRPVIYADIPFHRDILSDGDLSEYPFWIRSVKDLPQQRYPGRNWSFWQYTATGTIPGIPAKVDRNVFAGSHQHWQQALATGFRTLKGDEPHHAKPKPTPQQAPKQEDESPLDPTPEAPGEDLIAKTPLGEPLRGAAPAVQASFTPGAAVPQKPVIPQTPMATGVPSAPIIVPRTPAVTGVPAAPIALPKTPNAAVPLRPQPGTLGTLPASGAMPMPQARTYNPNLPMPKASDAVLTNPTVPLAKPKKKECPYGVPVC